MSLQHSLAGSTQSPPPGIRSPEHTHRGPLMLLTVNVPHLEGPRGRGVKYTVVVHVRHRRVMPSYEAGPRAASCEPS